MKSGLIIGICAVATAALLVSSSADAADGAAIWKANKCHSCHGDAGKADTKIGKKKGIPDMTTAEWQGKFTDEQIKKGIKEGVNREENGKKVKMKAYKKLSAEDVDALLALIRSWGPK